MKEKKVGFAKHSLVGVFHSPSQEASPCVITCHGLYSSKDSEKYVNIARRFCREGLTVLRFDFRGCGESADRFEETSVTGRMKDLEDALDFVLEQGCESIGVMGSSLGGTVAILAAAKDERIKALVTWATPCHLEELFRKEVIKGLEKLRQDISNHNVVKAVKEIHCPVLIVHGSMDKQVPLSHAGVLYENANEPKKIQIINGAGHRFASHFHRRRAVDLTSDWFKSHLIKRPK